MDLKPYIESNEVIPISDTLRSWLAKPKLLYINGKWTESKSEQHFSTINPATEGSISNVMAASRSDVNEAVVAAAVSHERGDWASVPIAERAKKLRQIGDLIESHRSELAILETLDTGKPIRESYEGDIFRAASNFHFFADYAMAHQNPSYLNEAHLHYSVREPIGVAALITPWNLPLYLETWKIAPALLMGNSCVLKPSELTPLTAQYFTELLESVDLPPGVFNLVQGFGDGAAGEFLTSHPRVDAISFTGETTTGKAIMKAAADNLTKVSFELGGKGANILFADGDFDQALNESLRAAFRNQGEVCLACPRIFVQAPIYEKFVNAFVDQAKSIRLGNPLSFHTQMGALISRGHRDKVKGYIEKAEGKLQCGGISRQEKGYFISPTVVTDLDNSHPISQEEVFGPLVAIYPFNTEEEVVGAANSTRYGLSASVWTNDLSRAQRVVRALKMGLVWVNCWFVRDLRVPFGGQKNSGIGREGGQYSLDFFSDWKSVCIRSFDT